MTPPRCSFCVSDPQTRVQKLLARRDKLITTLTMTQEQIWIVTEELKSLGYEFVTVKGGKRT